MSINGQEIPEVDETASERILRRRHGRGRVDICKKGGCGCEVPGTLLTGFCRKHHEEWLQQEMQLAVAEEPLRLVA